MFLQRTMSPWFAIQRVSQITMIVLTVALLFLPMLYLVEEAEAKKGKGGLLAPILSLLVEETCDNCGLSGVDYPAEHYVVCANTKCLERKWYCDYDPHKTVCGHCWTSYWDCPYASEAHEHDGSCST